VLNRHAEADDSVDSVEVGRIAVCDCAKLGVDEMIADLHDIASLVPLEMRVVGISEQEHLLGNLRGVRVSIHTRDVEGLQCV
jgi:hypothetical protein